MALECPHSGCSLCTALLDAVSPTLRGRGLIKRRGRLLPSPVTRFQFGAACGHESAAGSHAPQAPQFAVAASEAALGQRGCSCVLEPKELDAAFIILLRGCPVRGVLGSLGDRGEGTGKGRLAVRTQPQGCRARRTDTVRSVATATHGTRWALGMSEGPLCSMFNHCAVYRN